MSRELRLLAIYWPFVAAWAGLFVLPPTTPMALAARWLLGRGRGAGQSARLALAATGGNWRCGRWSAAGTANRSRR